MAKSATTVFPEPTSPCSRRFMRRGAAMSWPISFSTFFCAPVSAKGRRWWKGFTRKSLRSKAIPGRDATARWRASACSSCRKKSSSKASRRRPCSASASDGAVDVVQRLPERLHLHARQHLGRDAVLLLAHPAQQLVQVVVDELAHLPMGEPLG